MSSRALAVASSALLASVAALALTATPALAAGTQTLKVSTSGTGAGTVSSSPGGIECGNGAATCEAEFAEGETLTLFATPTERSAFAGWTVTGAPACPGTGSCEVTLTAATEVKAEFTAIPQRKLTVTTEGTGAGTVFGTSPGPEFAPIECGATCEATYNQGATIVLFAFPAEHSAFTGWSGCTAELSPTECEVQLGSSATAVKATFGPLPEPLTGSASGLTRTAATLEGSVNPKGLELQECAFEYGTEAGVYGQSVPCAESAATIGEGTAPVEVKAEITGLTAATAYHFRLLAKNDLGTELGADQSFETLPAVDSLATEAATAITGSSATLHGSFKGNAEDTRYYFQWGLNTSYEHSTPLTPEDLGSPSGHTPVPPVDLTGLIPTTEYHFRVLATNPFGTTAGPDQAFETLTDPAISAAPNTGYAIPTGELPTTSTTLHARVNPENGGNVTVCHFEYGTEANDYSAGQVPCMAGEAGNETEVGTPSSPVESTTEVNASLTGLSPGATYHYRLVVASLAGSTEEPDQSFTATPFLPSVEASSVSSVTTGTATLESQINPGFGPTVYRFQWGTSTSYGSSTQFGEVPVGADGTDHQVSAAISGLIAGTTYHFRVDALNFAGLVEGTDQTFTTQKTTDQAPATTPPPTASPPEEVAVPAIPSPKCPRGKVSRHRRCMNKKHRHHRSPQHPGHGGAR